ncbi:MAG: hypothetical protein FWG12_07875 [Holophagaceae bacterium]|nr:hypothetical protein [Holophagaceae bacterium]
MPEHPYGDTVDLEDLINAIKVFKSDKWNYKAVRILKYWFSFKFLYDNFNNYELKQHHVPIYSESLEFGACRTYNLKTEIILHKILISIDEIWKTLGALPSINSIRYCRIIASSGDARIEFTYNGMQYLVATPFGNDGYWWIRPTEAIKSPEDNSNVAEISAAFRNHKTSFVRKLFGYIKYFSFIKSRFHDL